MIVLGGAMSAGRHFVEPGSGFYLQGAVDIVFFLRYNNLSCMLMSHLLLREVENEKCCALARAEQVST